MGIVDDVPVHLGCEASRREGSIGTAGCDLLPVSTADQSCERQERELRAFADRAGYETVAVFRETGSGAKLNRVERRQVMALAQGRHIDVVLVTELSRWGRSTLDLLETLRELEARRVSVVAMTGMTFDLSSATGRMMATVLAGIAAFERDLLRERVRSGLAAARARGRVLGRQPGQRPKSDRLAPKVLALVEGGTQLSADRAGTGPQQEHRGCDRAAPSRAGSGTRLVSRAKGPPSDPYRKARFREEARDIVAKDRWERKYGRAVDTGGAIARALERAYKQGFCDAQGDPRPAFTAIPADGPLDWALIPPRPRSAFWSCCLYMYGRKGDRERPGWLEPAPTERGTMGWRLVVEGFDPDKVIGNSSIEPLVDLDLMELVEGTQDRLTVSARGRATWERFLAAGGEYPEDLPPF